MKLQKARNKTCVTTVFSCSRAVLFILTSDSRGLSFTVSLSNGHEHRSGGAGKKAGSTTLRAILQGAAAFSNGEIVCLY